MGTWKLNEAKSELAPEWVEEQHGRLHRGEGQMKVTVGFGQRGKPTQSLGGPGMENL
jgi:hypothetical protein